ncbi:MULTISPECIES: hypothetical protein [Sphingobacterium]|uniref:hypothetical protein n=1 Tax=Sphingobacterium TaxID=28453 RepID=UPI0013D91334|nr:MULTISPECIES: hypothetical protein [unclassified Sphingobacterium]
MRFYILIVGTCLIMSCQKQASSLMGSYRLIESTTIKDGDTVYVQVDSAKTEMIKVINATHFAFFNHDKNQGKDSTTLFVSGGGRYQLKGNEYTENLDFCSYRPWEGKQFKFTISLKGDTLTQQGKEELPELGIKQHITEKYIKIR